MVYLGPLGRCHPEDGSDMPANCDCIYCKPDKPSQRASDAAFMMTGGVYPSEERSVQIEADAKSIAQSAKGYLRRLYGADRHQEQLKEYDLEDAGFTPCKNCNTTSLTNEYGLCQYCDELSELNRKAAVHDSKLGEIAQKRANLKWNHWLYWGALGCHVAIVGSLQLIVGQFITWLMITPVLYVVLVTKNYRSQNHKARGAIRVLQEDLQETAKFYNIRM